MLSLATRILDLAIGMGDAIERCLISSIRDFSRIASAAILASQHRAGRTSQRAGLKGNSKKLEAT
jgi:hypothetical protein